jgi:cathepsin B
MVNVEEI